MSHLLAPSLLSANFLNLEKDIALINSSKADWLHLDVMDGVFVPNISFGFPVIKAVKQLCKKPLDAHLMIVDPDKYLDECKAVGCDIVTVHYETCKHLHRTVQRIKSLGMKAGVSLNPHSPVSLLEEIIVDLDLVLIMSVNPGFGGQKFIPSSLTKITKLKQLIESAGAATLIEVDGGVGIDNYASIVKAGANVLVAGNAVFGATNQDLAIEQLKQSV